MTELLGHMSFPLCYLQDKVSYGFIFHSFKGFVGDKLVCSHDVGGHLATSHTQATTADMYNTIKR